MPRFLLQVSFMLAKGVARKSIRLELKYMIRVPFRVSKKDGEPSPMS